MCSSCDHDRAYELATEILNALPAWKTRVKEIVENVREGISDSGHVSEGQLEMLERMAEENIKQAPKSFRRTSVQAEPQKTVAPLTKRIIWLAPKSQTVAGRMREQHGISIAKSKLPQNSHLITHDGSAWESIRKQAGGWGNLAPWMARTYEGAIVFGTAAGPWSLSRVVFTATGLFLAANKPVCFVSHELNVFGRVVAAERIEGDARGSWQENFGTVACRPIVTIAAPLGLPDPSRVTDEAEAPKPKGVMARHAS